MPIPAGKKAIKRRTIGGMTQGCTAIGCDLEGRSESRNLRVELLIDLPMNKPVQDDIGNGGDAYQRNRDKDRRGQKQPGTKRGC